MMKVYKFLYCSCIFESSYSTISLHRTKAGAYKAMRHHIMTEYQNWYEDRIRFGKNKDLGQKFGCHEAWTIDEQEVYE
jgi:hypothetical protein